LGHIKSIILGNPQNFFVGSDSSVHMCQCGLDGSCISDSGNTFSCNCDAKTPEWAMDSGAITAKAILPITGFSYGPLKFDVEQANFTIGRLRCLGTRSRSQYACTNNTFNLFH
jgi:hypothetical protein